MFEVKTSQACVLVASVVAVVATVQYFSLSRRKCVSWFDEARAAGSVKAVDDACEDDEGAEVVEAGVPVAGRRRFASHVANVVRARIGGTPRRTEANRLMVQKMVRDYMKERCVRESHMPLHAPLACSLVFVPTKYEVEAAKFEATAVADERSDDVRGWGRFVPSGAWGFLGFSKFKAGLGYSSG